MKFHTVLLSGFIACLTISSAEPSTSASNLGYEIQNNKTVLQGWIDFENRIKSLANSVVKTALPMIMETSGDLNLSSQCMRQCLTLMSGMRKIKPWALRFVDSSAKLIDGVLVGSLSAFGAYDECIETVATSEKFSDKGKTLFRGQYCTVELKPPVPIKSNFYKLDDVLEDLKNFSQRGTAVSDAAKYAHFFHFLALRLGICVPSGCSLHDMNQLSKLVGDQLALSARTTRCELKEENEYTPVIIAVMCCFSFAGLLLAIGTLIDLYAYHSKKIFHNKAICILLAFSFISNFKKFANTRSSSDTLSCLSGVRFLCMSWVILGHTYLTANYQVFVNFEKVRTFAKDFAFQAIVNASVAVDTFFFIGGLLLCYLTIKVVKIGGKPLNYKLYIFHRLWRILPVYSYVIMFMFLGPLLGSGPIWYDTTHHYLQACYDNWWTNLVFINNFYDATNMCIPQSWYLACDFQLYIAALFILLPLIRWPKVGIFLSICVIVASMVYSAVGTYLNNYPPAMLFAHPDPEQRIRYWADFYFQPFVHAGPYVIGILSGYLLATKPDLKIPKVLQLLGWSSAIVFNMSVLYGVLGWNMGNEPTFVENMAYSACNRVAWTLGVAWMVVCCCTGHGGVVNYILSWKAWIPLGRLTFLAYLVHPLVQIIVIGNIRTNLQPDHFFAIWVYFGHLCVTYGCAFAGTMLIEAPCLSLEKIMFPRSSKKTRDTNLVKDSSILKGNIYSDKTGDIAVIIPDRSTDNNSGDNQAFVYKL